MLGLLITVALPIIVAVVLTACIILKHMDIGYEGFIPAVVVFFLIIIGGISLCIYPCYYFGSMDTVSQLEAFSEDTLSAYEYAISETQEVEINAAKAGLLADVTYFEQGKVAGDRVKEFRDKVRWYNDNLRVLERRNNHWLLDDFYYDAPEHLAPITLK